MDTSGAYGGGKAGGAFDPQQFIQRPPVIVRAVCWVRYFVFTLCGPHVRRRTCFSFRFPGQEERVTSVSVFISRKNIHT